MQVGIVFGCFIPLHQGHIYLIESRYGKDHIWYKQSKEVCDILKDYTRRLEYV